MSKNSKDGCALNQHHTPPKKDNEITYLPIDENPYYIKNSITSVSGVGIQKPR